MAIQEFRVVEGKPDARNLDDFGKFELTKMNFGRQIRCVAYCYHLNFIIIAVVPEYVVKAQILAGGRGKGHFDNGFKGGVHITKQ